MGHESQASNQADRPDLACRAGDADFVQHVGDHVYGVRWAVAEG